MKRLIVMFRNYYCNLFIINHRFRERMALSFWLLSIHVNCLSIVVNNISYVNLCQFLVNPCQLHVNSNPTCQSCQCMSIYANLCQWLLTRHLCQSMSIIVNPFQFMPIKLNPCRFHVVFISMASFFSYRNRNIFKTHVTMQRMSTVNDSSII